MAKTFFITGIDTDIGKTYVIGKLLGTLLTQHAHATSFKLIQTGVAHGEISEDILHHREISGIPLSEADKRGDSVGIQFSLPASPHLAAYEEGQVINPSDIYHKLQSYIKQSRADIVLCEGAGGIFVPITHTYLTVDFIQDYSLPLILVTSAKLGSINHTVATLEALAARNIAPLLVIYNRYPLSPSKILQDTEHWLATHIANHFPHTRFTNLLALTQHSNLTAFFQRLSP